MPIYDSTNETLKHIDKVQRRLDEITANLNARRLAHDASKLLPGEKEAFDSLGPPEEMAALVYGSEEYKAKLRSIKPAIDHHYAVNDHHPEHFPNGIVGMSLMALLELLADWKAAGERHSTGNLADSLAKNRERFHIEPQLQAILENTAKELGWL